MIHEAAQASGNCVCFLVSSSAALSACICLVLLRVQLVSREFDQLPLTLDRSEIVFRLFGVPVAAFARCSQLRGPSVHWNRGKIGEARQLPSWCQLALFKHTTRSTIEAKSSSPQIRCNISLLSSCIFNNGRPSWCFMPCQPSWLSPF